MSKIIAYAWAPNKRSVAHIVEDNREPTALCGTHSNRWTPWPTNAMKLKTPSTDQQCVKCRRLGDFAQVATEWQAKMHADHTAYLLQRDLEWAEAQRQGWSANELLTAMFKAKFAGDSQARLLDSPRHGLVLIYANERLEITLGIVDRREIGGDA